MGGGNYLFGTQITEDKTTPVFRGNVSMVEVASVDTNPTKLPDVEPLQSGKIDTTTTRCFDLFCVGKYEQGSDLKLDIQPADKIPNLITKNSNGDPVFAEPKPMCTVRAPKGHNVWVKIYLETITTNASDYMVLGIKKQCEDEYLDILHTGNSSRYVDVLETDVVELIPLVSSTPLSEKYTAVNPGDTAKIMDKTTYDFGSVYRVHISLHDSQWLTDQKCDLSDIYNGNWFDYGQIGTGPVINQSGNSQENQLFAINRNTGTLAYSSDGTHWTKNSKITEDRGIWWSSLVYGNGIWCAIDWTSHGVKRSIDGGKSWSSTFPDIHACCLNFANNIFMTVVGNTGGSTPGSVYISPDAEIWTQIASINFTAGNSHILAYGDNKWICGSWCGYIYQSKDGKTWKRISDALHQRSVKDNNSKDYWIGGCYVNGYFYVIRRDGLIARSSDGVEWKEVFDFTASNITADGNLTTCYCNITYYKNKLWAFSENGQKYVVGLFNPDGTIESLE